MSNRNPQLQSLIERHDAEYELAHDPTKQGTERILNLGYIGVDWPAIRAALVEGGQLDGSEKWGGR